MKLRFSLLFSFLFLFPWISQGQKSLSENATISLYTCGIGDLTHTVFGHSGIRVSDPVQNLDIVFNYGIFDFDDPNFLMNFLKGRLLYQLGIQRNRNFIKNYTDEKRTVYEQVFDLTPTQKTEFYNFLVENYKPENRKYPYDFFADNCSSRIRDIFDITTPSIQYPKKLYDRTYRDMLDEHLTKTPWMDFGIDLILGAVADDSTSRAEQFFLPLYMFDYLDKTIIDNHSLVKKTDIVVDFIEMRENQKATFITPKLVFGILLLLEIFLLILFLKSPAKKIKVVRFYDYFIFFAMGLGSIILAFMWWGTDHVPTKDNWNLLWMNPLFIVLVPLYHKQGNKIYTVIGALIIFINIFLLCRLIPIPQRFHTVSYIIMAITTIKIARTILANRNMQA